jgi:protein tyrosine phosphatase (PTP) superfamily phosphohydrolase (DUF442 family)
LPASAVAATIELEKATNIRGKIVHSLKYRIRKNSPWALLVIWMAYPLSVLATPQVTDIYNYYPMPANLGTSGQPTPEQFAAIKAAGFDTVINLAMPTSENALPDEGRLVAEQGMTYVHIPVPWEAPSEDHLQQFFGVVDTMITQGQKVWIHCAANYRASAFTYRYLIQQQGLPPAEASTPLLQLWLPQMDENWRRIYGGPSAQGSQP